MAARNVKLVPGFDAADKMQSSTLKRQPSPDWSKNDLLRLLSYFEGELQARDIVIAALKAEKAKHLLYQAKYGRFGLGDPFVALQRDTIGTRDCNFDEAAVKSMYDNQLAQLENLIATQRKAQLKMREQLASAEKRYHKVCCELEDEKRKHAQDTAQGDDVTYMLEKERERLRQEIDFEKSSCKKLEKDLRRTLAAVEEERSSAARHKQVALLLLKERKHILHKLATQTQSGNLPESKVGDPDFESESQHSLAMGTALEEQLSGFEAERAALRASLDQEQNRTRDLESQVEVLQRQLQSLAARTVADSIEIKSGVASHLTATLPSASFSPAPYTPQRAGSLSPSINPVPNISLGMYPAWGVSPNAPSASPNKVAVIGSNTSVPVLRQVPRAHKVVESGLAGSASPEREVIHRPVDSLVRKPACESSVYGSGLDRQTGNSAGILSSSPRPETRVVTLGSSGPESGPLLVSSGGSSSCSSTARVNIAPGNSATVVTQGGGKISFHVSPGSSPVGVGVGSSGSPRRTISPAASSPVPTPMPSSGRGGPPPVPPNKPNIPPGSSPKPAPPPKAAVIGRSIVDSKMVQIPISVVTSSTSPPSSSPSPSSSNQSSRETSPIRKSAQLSVGADSYGSAVCWSPSPSMSLLQPSPAPAPPSRHFLDPQMDRLQQLLASLNTGEASARDSPSLMTPRKCQDPSPLTSSSVSSAPSFSFPILSSPLQLSTVNNINTSSSPGASQMKLATEWNNSQPLKDGSTPVHCAVENNQPVHLQLLMENDGNVNAVRDGLVTPIHIASAHGYHECLRILLQHGAVVNCVSATGDTPLHLALNSGHIDCCHTLLQHGASLLQLDAIGLSALHHAVLSGNADLLSCLLESLNCGLNHGQCYTVLSGLVQGTTLLHLAAQLPTPACLQLLLTHFSHKWNIVDCHGNLVTTIASPACKDMLSELSLAGDGSENFILVVELKTQLEGRTVSCTRIGHLDLTPYVSWEQLEKSLCLAVQNFLSQLDTGLRTHRLARIEKESARENSLKFTLGISMDKVTMFELGYHCWSPGMLTEVMPYSIASSSADKKVVIIIDGADNLSELIAFDILHPVPTIQDYLHQVFQHKNVAFHGPLKSGKSYLVQRLAQCLAAEKKREGLKPVIAHLKLTPHSTHRDLLSFLLSKGCLLKLEDKTATAMPLATPHILIVDNLERLDLPALFGPLLSILRQRGMHSTCQLTEPDIVTNSEARFCFSEHLYILATFNYSRLTDLHIDVKEQFYWVHLKTDSEPLCNLLARHFLRRLYHLGNGKLPGMESGLLSVTEWLIGVWQRLNGSLSKLGLSDVVLGPCGFFKCPLEKQDVQLILQWVQDMWNSEISPRVREAVKRGTGSQSTASNQHRVANTALYVLLQRTIVLSCPLPAHEKEAYLKGFSGSNELDVPFRVDKVEQGTGPRQSPVLGSLMAPSGLTPAVSSPAALGSDLQGQGSPPPATLWSPADARSRIQRTAIAAAAVSQTSSKQRLERGRTVELFAGCSIKRRSLSESSVNKAAQATNGLVSADEGLSSMPSAHEAKVPKLEVRSSKIVSLANSFKTRQSQAVADSELRQDTSPPTVSILSQQHKKALSSENLSPNGLEPSIGHNPFSFSLTTPRSSLSTFKLTSNAGSGQRLFSSLSSSSPFSSSSLNQSPFSVHEYSNDTENRERSSHPLPVWRKQFNQNFEHSSDNSESLLASGRTLVKAGVESLVSDSQSASGAQRNQTFKISSSSQSMPWAASDFER